FHPKCSRLQKIADGKEPELTLSFNSSLDSDLDASNFWDGPEPMRSNKRLVASPIRADEMESVHYKGEGECNPPTIADPVAEHHSSLDPEVNLERILDTEGHEVFVESFPCPHADHKAFEIAELLMQPGITAHFRNSFLHLKQLHGKLPWHNNCALHKDIDKLLHGPDWEVQLFKLTGNSGEEVVELWK
ncbi:hypothetical protein FRC11_000694, partial [Ceratobasidium sp. 423]